MQEEVLHQNAKADFNSPQEEKQMEASASPQSHYDHDELDKGVSLAPLHMDSAQTGELCSTSLMKCFESGMMIPKTEEVNSHHQKQLKSYNTFNIEQNELLSPQCQLKVEDITQKKTQLICEEAVFQGQACAIPNVSSERKQELEINHLLKKNELRSQQPDQGKLLEEKSISIDPLSNFKNEFMNILKKVHIDSEEEVRQCLDLFQKGQTEELKEYPKKSYRKQFSFLIDKLLLMMQQTRNEQANKKQQKQEANLLTQLLQKPQIRHKLQVNKCIAPCPQGTISQLQVYPQNSLRQNQCQQLESMLSQLSLEDNRQRSKKTSMELLLIECGIKQQKLQLYEQYIQMENFQFLLSLPEKARRKLIKQLQKHHKIRHTSLETQLRLSLSPYLTDKDVQCLLEKIKTKEDYLDDLDQTTEEIVNARVRQFQITLTLQFEKTKKKTLRFNELILQHDPTYLQQEIVRIVKLDLDQITFFKQNQMVKLKDISFKAGQTAILQLFKLKEYTFQYGLVKRSIKVLPEKQFSQSKQIIYSKLIQEQVIKGEPLESFDLNKMRFRIEDCSGKMFSDLAKIRNFSQFEQQFEEIKKVFVEIETKVTLYFNHIKEEYTFFSSDKLQQLKTIINKKYVPFQSQTLHLLRDSDHSMKITDKGNQSLCQIASELWLKIQLTNQESLEFYGFQNNFPLTFHNFSSCFIQNLEAIQLMIQNCSFDLGHKQSEEIFIKTFILSVFTGIKKRFPLNTIIEKYKSLVSKIKYQSIWVPKSEAEKDFIKVNDSFLLAYLLHNADDKLKIQLMNLVKENMPLPLYVKSFENVYKVEEQMKLNESLLWIIKKGYVITSVGLHTTEKMNQQCGKSFLLNQIFPTHFQKRQNKQAIIQGIPYIAIGVYQNFYPLHVIDIPQECPESIKEEILSISNIILVHSWRSEQQTENYLENIKKKFKTPIICLLRDSKQKNILQSLKENNISKEKCQRILNFSSKELYKGEISLLKQQIFQFMKKYLNEECSQNTIYELFRKSEIYELHNKFIKIVEILKDQMLDLCPIGEKMASFKKMQTEPDKIQNFKQNHLKKIFKQQLIDILIFLADEKVRPYLNSFITLLRQKIKAYQHQFNMYFLKIYDLRDFFTEIKNINAIEQRQKKMTDLNKQLLKFKQLNPKSIVSKDNAAIQIIINDMINEYENKVKPNIFSVQLFWRELNYVVSIDPNFKIGEHLLISILKDLKNIQISNCLPFEIIDGDLLEIPKRLMTELFELREEKTIVISVLGPQSSGKSTLLNFLFGCDFATSEGRCTRGVYGTYFKFVENKGHVLKKTHCEGVFVIDTEGLFAITNEKDRKDEDRKNFDSKLVLFCLAVSDFVVINVRGNLDQNTERIFRLCHERLDDLNIKKQKRPQIIVVLNQNASDNKIQSQNEFKEIKKSIDFEISKSLSLAYQNVNYSSLQVSLLGKNQKLIKKYPLEAFLCQTSNLMNEIIKKIMIKKEIMKLSEIIQKFQRIWAMVIAFPNLSKAVTNEYRELQKKIKQWKDKFDQDEKIKLLKQLSQFSKDEITEQKIMEEIQVKRDTLLQQFSKQFKEEFQNEEQIKQLKRSEKNKISSKTQETISNIKYEIENIKLKKQIKLSKLEGDLMLREKAKEIFKQKQDFTEEQLKDIFDQCFKEQLIKIQLKLNLGQEIRRQYQTIFDNYQFLMRNQTGCEKGLPKEKGWIGDEKCDVHTMLNTIKEKIVEPNQKYCEEVLVHTNKIHTDIFKGGKTDASLEYFSVKDYFKTEVIDEKFIINKSHLQLCLKTEILHELFNSYVDEAKKKVDINQLLGCIWQNINVTLTKIGLRFTSFKNFKELFEFYENSYFNRFLNWFKTTKLEVNYEFLNVQKEIEITTHKYECNKQYCNCHEGQLHEKLIVSHQNHHFSPFLHQYINQNSAQICLCSYSKYDPPSYLRPCFYRHINWEAILSEVQKAEDYKQKIKHINQTFTRTINQDIKGLNMTIPHLVNWKQFFKNPQKSIIPFEQIVKEPLILDSFEKLSVLAENTMFVCPRQLALYCKKNEGRYMGSNDLLLLIVRAERFEPIDKNSFFSHYLKSNTTMTIKSLKSRPFCIFILDQLKNNSRKSLSKFFFNIFKIVETKINHWQTADNKALFEIYNKVNQQIGKFNNDLNQISYNLAEKYIGYINLAVVYMIWKLIIDKKIKQKSQILLEKKNAYDCEWQLFKTRTSKDEDRNVQGDIDQFLKELFNNLEEVVKKKKVEEMNIHKKQFALQNSRQKVQAWLDMEIFRIDVPAENILQYLESPFQAIQQKYQICYQQSYQDLKRTFQTVRVAKDVMHQFFDVLKTVDKLFEQSGIDDTKNSFSDIFDIADKKAKDQSLSSTKHQQYQQQGKRVLFQYFIDTLLGARPDMFRQCAKVNVSPKMPIEHNTKITKSLRGILLEIRKAKLLTMTNLSKFVKRLLSSEMTKIIFEMVNEMNVLTPKDQLNYCNSIKVVICEEKCPCCGRICGCQGYHQYHECLYGHQMRGLNGTYLESSGKNKQASVIRCQEMQSTDLMKYNGRQYTWIQFKDYWKSKHHGGWLFNDTNNLNDQTKQKFQKAWTIAGPIYCKKNGLKYVNFNMSEQQRKDGLRGPVHYIFALDESGSMGGDNWRDLLISFNKAMIRIKEKDVYRKENKVSVIKFSDTANIVYQNQQPANVQTNLVCKNGPATDFDPPFCLAAQIALKYIINQTIVFVFMTDGCANIPLKGIKALKQIQLSYPKKLWYAGIQFCSSVDIMKTIAAELKGKTGVANNVQELTDLFVRSIEIIEFREQQ